MRFGQLIARQSQPAQKAAAQGALRNEPLETVRTSRRVQDAWRRSLAGIFAILLLTVFVNILKVAIPLYIFQLLDRVVASRSVDTLILLSTITVFAVVCGSIADWVRKWMLVHSAAWIAQHFGMQLFLLSLNRPNRRPPARALTDLSDVGDFLAGSAASNWLDVIGVPVFLFIVYQIEPRLAFVVFLGLLTVLLVGLLGEVASRPVRKTLRQAKRRSDMWLSTVEQKLETVASLNIASKIAGRWERSSRRRARASAANRLISGATGEIMRLAESLQRIVCYAVGIWLVMDGALSVGAVIAAAVLGRFATSGLRKAMQNWRTLMLAVRAYKRTKARLQEFSEAKAPIRDSSEAAALHIDQITHTHSSWSRPLFSMLDVRVAPGEILCIAGASGTGKSTLARLVSGTATPTMGTVRVGGLDVSRYSETDRQNFLGYLQQQVELLNGTIAENISSLRPAEDAKIIEASRLSGVHEIVSRLTDGYETKIDPKKSTLSGGEIRRLGLARAFYGSPSLIVLDEPEANLDAKSFEQLLDALEVCRARGAILVITTQKDRLALIADKIIRLKPGSDAVVFESSAAYQASIGSAHTNESKEAEPIQATAEGRA